MQTENPLPTTWYRGNWESTQLTTSLIEAEGHRSKRRVQILRPYTDTFGIINRARSICFRRFKTDGSPAVFSEYLDFSCKIKQVVPYTEITTPTQETLDEELTSLEINCSTITGLLVKGGVLFIAHHQKVDSNSQVIQLKDHYEIPWILEEALELTGRNKNAMIPSIEAAEFSRLMRKEVDLPYPTTNPYDPLLESQNRILVFPPDMYKYLAKRGEEYLLETPDHGTRLTYHIQHALLHRLTVSGFPIRIFEKNSNPHSNEDMLVEYYYLNLAAKKLTQILLHDLFLRKQIEEPKESLWSFKNLFKIK